VEREGINARAFQELEGAAEGSHRDDRAVVLDEATLAGVVREHIRAPGSTPEALSRAANVGD
jgi:hypothetical protein